MFLYFHQNKHVHVSVKGTVQIMQLLKIFLLPNFKQRPKNKLLKTRNNDVNHMKLAKLSTPDKNGNR